VVPRIASGVVPNDAENRSEPYSRGNGKDRGKGKGKGKSNGKSKDETCEKIATPHRYDDYLDLAAAGKLAERRATMYPHQPS